MSYSFPREILKWIQTLGLEQSFSDHRRDLNNGYVFAMIVSKFHEREVMPHAFQNSQSSAAKENNWRLLARIFARIGFEPTVPLREVADGRLDPAINLAAQLYTFLTKRPLQLQKRVIIRKSHQAFLLTEAGLEPYDAAQYRARPPSQTVVAHPADPEPQPDGAAQHNSNFALDQAELGQMLNTPATEKLEKPDVKSSRSLASFSHIQKSQTQLGATKAAAKGAARTANAKQLREYKQVFEKLNDYIQAALGSAAPRGSSGASAPGSVEAQHGYLLSLLPQPPLLYYSFSQNAASVPEATLLEVLARLEDDMEENVKLLAKDANDAIKVCVFLLNLQLALPEPHAAHRALCRASEAIVGGLVAADFEMVFYLLKHFLFANVVEALRQGPERAQAASRFLGFFLARDFDHRRRVLDLAAAAVTDRELLLAVFELLLSFESEKDERNRAHLKKIKALLKRVRQNDSFRAKLSYLRALTRLTAIDAKFARKHFAHAGFLFAPEQPLELRGQALSFLSTLAADLFASDSYRELRSQKSKHGKSLASLPHAGKEKSCVARAVERLLEFLQRVMGAHSEPLRAVFVLLFFPAVQQNRPLCDLFLQTALSPLFRDFAAAFGLGAALLPPTQRLVEQMGLQPSIDRAALLKAAPFLLSALLRFHAESAGQVAAANFWQLFCFCFEHCAFEDINFENLDSIINDAFALLDPEGEAPEPDRVSVLVAIAVFHVKAEVLVRDFECKMQRFLRSPQWGAAVVAKLQQKYESCADNEVLQRKLRTTFPNVAFTDAAA